MGRVCKPTRKGSGMIFECDCPECEMYFSLVVDDYQHVICPNCEHVFDSVDFMDYCNARTFFQEEWL